MNLLFSCQEKTTECQEKTDFGHSKLGFHFGARRKGPRARRKRIWACICFSPARRKRLSSRRKQNLVILSLVLTVEPGEKVHWLGQNKFGHVFAFLLPGENRNLSFLAWFLLWSQSVSFLLTIEQFLFQALHNP